MRSMTSVWGQNSIIIITELALESGNLGYCMKPGTIDLGFGNIAMHYGMSFEVSDLCLWDLLGE